MAEEEGHTCSTGRVQAGIVGSRREPFVSAHVAICVKRLAGIPVSTPRCVSPFCGALRGRRRVYRNSVRCWFVRPSDRVSSRAFYTIESTEIGRPRPRAESSLRFSLFDPRGVSRDARGGKEGGSGRRRRDGGRGRHVSPGLSFYRLAL